MKNAHPKVRRRAFLQTAAQTAAGIALGKATQFQVKAAQKGVSRKKRDNAISKKLGDLQPHPDPNTAFHKLKQRRMPGWRADTADVGNPKDEYYFEEEAIAQRNVNGAYVYHRFPPPNLFPEPPQGQHPTPFKEPANPNDYAAWHTFNQWMLGGFLDEDSTTDFDILLNEISKRVRRYNAALYWLRRLHFAEDAPPNSTPPPSNPHGDNDDNGNYTPVKGTADFKNRVSLAEDEWMNAVDSLNKIFSGDEVPHPNPNLPYIAADMIEVNGYIVSMRIIAQKDDFKAKGTVGAYEVVGSSSSHISISSAFRYP